MREFSRRQLLGIGGSMGLVLAGGLGVGASLAHRPAQTGAVLPSTAPVPDPYSVPLPIPPVLKPTSTADGVDRYAMVQRAVSAEVLPGLRTDLWTYQGSFPGPTIEARRGRPVVVEHRNELPRPTVVHLHGGRTPAESDGYPTDLVTPQGWQQHGMHHGMADDRAVTSSVTRSYRYPQDQRAALLWYHDHRMDFTAPALWRGLAGMHVIRDEIEDTLSLPAGDRELLLMVTDRSFAADGSFRYPARDPELMTTPGVSDPYGAGVLGDVILVNGAPWPEHEVDATRYRLRLLNASNARHYDLALQTDDGRELDLVQVGSDQGLLAAPVRLRTLPFAPAERYDVVVDFADLPVGAQVRLINRLGQGRTRAVMAFRVARRAVDESHLPQQLANDLPDWRRSSAQTVRDLAFRSGDTHHGRGWVIGGEAFDPSRTDVSTRLGAVEVWRLVADVHHPIHLHLVGFRVLSRGGKAPLPHDAGLKDTVSLRPGESCEIITRFDGYPGRYLFHCHNAEHEDMGMMANLEIAP